MDYCRMIYEIFKTDQGVWAEMIGRLLDRCADKVPVVRLIFYAAPADNREYLQWKRELQQLVDERFPAPRPVVSLVAQRPLDTGLVMEVHGLEPDFQGKVTEVAMEGEGYYLRIEKEGFREVLLGGVCGEDPDMPVTQQSANGITWNGLPVIRMGISVIRILTMSVRGFMLLRFGLPDIRQLQVSGLSTEVL